MKRIVPEWKSLFPQIKQKIQASRARDTSGWPDEEEEEEAVFLDASPAMTFRGSCAPGYLRCLAVHSSSYSRVAVGFLWGHALEQHRMEAWVETEEREMSRFGSFPLEGGYLVERLLFVPGQRLFVGYCSDVALRLYGDLKQQVGLLQRAACPGSVTSMHYSQETGEVVTGGVGLIAFWGFWPRPQQPIGVTRLLDWSCCSLRRDTFVRGLATERQSLSLFALCGAAVRAFDCLTKQETRAFAGASRGTLLCCAPCAAQRHLYTGDSAGCVQVWSWDTRGLLQEFRAHARAVTGLLLPPAAGTCLTASADGWVREWSRAGELLRQLLAEPAGVAQLLPLGEDRFVCASPCAFSVWSLPGICRLFNATGCPLRRISRVQCGPGRARLLAVTQDGGVRLLCPVTGQMVLLSWPFLLLEEALDYAYDPGREELFVATGSADVLVLDAARCPCPAKHFLSTSGEREDGVLCLEAVTSPGEPCLVLGGHRNGRVSLLSPPRRHALARKAHDGAVVQMSSLPGGRQAQLCCYGTDHLLSLWRVSWVRRRADLLPLARIRCSRPLLYTRLLPGQVCAVTRDHALLFLGPTGRAVEPERAGAPPITSLDYCAALGLVVTAGPEGTVELWDSAATLLAEITLGARLSQVCFANPRGDLLANVNGNTYLLPSLRFLPPRYLGALLGQEGQDDAVEDPLPFRPVPLEDAQVTVLPRYHLESLGGDAAPRPGAEPAPVGPGISSKPERPRKRSRISLQRQKEAQASPKTGTAREPDSRPGVVPEPAGQAPVGEEAVLGSIVLPTSQPQPQTPCMTPVLPEWPIAPDGFIPNSVIRGWGRRDGDTPDPDREESRSFLRHLQDLRETRSESSDTLLLGDSKRKRREQALKGRKGARPGPGIEVQGLELELPVEEDLLTQIANSPWLSTKPQVIDLESVVGALLRCMAQSCVSVYQRCASALLRLCQAYAIPPHLRDRVQASLLGHTQPEEPDWRRLEGWRSLDLLSLLSASVLPHQARALLDPQAAVRALVRQLLSKAAMISEKTVLLRRLETMRTALPPFPSQLLQQVQDNLTEQLELAVPQDAGLAPSERAASPTDAPDRTSSRILSGTPVPPSLRQRPDMPEMMDIPGDTTSVPREEQGRADSGAGWKAAPQPVRTAPRGRAVTKDDTSTRVKSPARTQRRGRRREEGVREARAGPAPLPCQGGLGDDPTALRVYVTRVRSRRRRALPSPREEGEEEEGGRVKAAPPPTPCDAAWPQGSRAGPSCLRWGGQEGDPETWRDSLYKLISRYGFRSPKVQKGAGWSLDSVPTVSRAPPRPPPLRPPARDPTPGQRVLWKVGLRDPRERPPARFQHELPLPWRLSALTLDPEGESDYGRLELDWATGQGGALQDLPPLRLPPLTPAPRRAVGTPQSALCTPEQRR
nr:PREDICTED: WD repeat-containing protein 87 [Lepisosteus oculatus]